MIIGDKTIDGYSLNKITKGSEKRITIECDSCGIISTTQYNNYYKSQTRKGFNGITHCRKCNNKIQGKKRVGKITAKKGKKLPLTRCGKNHHGWKGGSYITSDGYRVIYTGPRANSNKGTKWDNYRKEHMIIVEKSIGRFLEGREAIHHIDGDKLNNNVNNLVLCLNEKEHQKIHKNLREISYILIKMGIVEFNKDTKEYYINYDRFV